VSNRCVSSAAWRGLSVGLVLAAGSLYGQTPSFEVASIKPSEPITPAMIQAGKLHAGMKIDGVRVDIGNFRLMQLIMKAYDVKMYQIKGDNSVLLGQPFDIVANLPAGATKEQVPDMLKKLLEERFKLKVHTDTQPQPVYALVAPEGGVKLKESVAPAEGSTPGAGVSGSSTATIQQEKGGATVNDGAGHTQKVTQSPDGKSIHFEITGATMAELAEGLSPLTGDPIVDKTGLKGRYDVVMDLDRQELMNAARAAGLQVPGEEAKAGEASDPSGAGSIFNTFKALGLKLERRKEPLTKIIIDHCEKMPTEN
jgi:uncharacterized protein (TIGR03435 family)